MRSMFVNRCCEEIFRSGEWWKKDEGHCADTFYFIPPKPPTESHLVWPH